MSVWKPIPQGRPYREFHAEECTRRLRLRANDFDNMAADLIDTLRRQLAEAEAKIAERDAEVERQIQLRHATAMDALTNLERAELAEARLALAEQDARRYRWWRKNAVWSQELDGFVRWIAFIAMPEPPMDVDTLTPDSVAECLDAGVDAAIAAGEGSREH